VHAAQKNETNNKMKKRLAIITSLVSVVLLVAACAATPESTADEPAQLSFIHLNDTYRVGAVEDGKRGGFGRVVTVVRELQASGREVRILHGGDFLYPSLESQLWNGLQMVDAMNYLDDLAPMYVTLGNHELDRRTPEHLINAVNASRFDWLGDNIRFATGEAEADDRLQSAFVFEAAGKKIGIFALLFSSAAASPVKGYRIICRDPMRVVRCVQVGFLRDCMTPWKRWTSSCSRK